MVPGRVSTEADPALSFDTEKTKNMVRRRPFSAYWYLRSCTFADPFPTVFARRLVT